MKPSGEIRLWLIFPAVGKQFECMFPLSSTFQTCLPFLSNLLEGEFRGRYRLDENTVFFETESGIPLSNTVTLSNQNLCDGMRLTVY